MGQRQTEVDPGQALVEALGLKIPQGPLAERAEEAFIGKYSGPSRFQRAVMRHVELGHSVLVVAPTASGKTEAAVIALTALALHEGGRILYIAPTRALINDLIGRLRPGFERLGLGVVARHAEAQVTDRQMSAAACVLITPEALEAALERSAAWLEAIRYLVLDE